LSLHEGHSEQDVLAALEEEDAAIKQNGEELGRIPCFRAGSIPTLRLEGERAASQKDLAALMQNERASGSTPAYLHRPVRANRVGMASR
jgi:hypothetical protein